MNEEKIRESVRKEILKIDNKIAEQLDKMEFKSDVPDEKIDEMGNNYVSNIVDKTIKLTIKECKGEIRKDIINQFKSDSMDSDLVLAVTPMIEGCYEVGENKIRKEWDSIVDEAREIHKINDGFHYISSMGIAKMCFKFLNQKKKEGIEEISDGQLSDFLEEYVKGLTKENDDFVEKVSKKKKSGET